MDAPKSAARRGGGWGLALALCLGPASWCAPHSSPKRPEFKFIGGTQYVQPGCVGKLEITSQAMTFTCAQYSIPMPFGSVRLMQYRTGLSRKVRKMKLHWKVRPQTVGLPFGKKQNRYFTVVYAREGTPEALVLKVAPEDMQPYLAEIDLAAGQRVEVEFTADND